jgi:5-methyltetrahydropteroyltriglutamate--homocysteine methyltransferase
VQIDEPYLPARPEPAAEYGVAAIDRALAGAAGPTVLHICFGYGRHVANKPARYDFLAELDGCSVDEISIEAAQPRLDLSVLDDLPSKRVQFGVLDLRDTDVESVDVVADRIRRALEHVAPDRLVVAPDCGCKYLSRDVARGKIDAMVRAAALVRSELASVSGR